MDLTPFGKKTPQICMPDFSYFPSENHCFQDNVHNIDLVTENEYRNAIISNVMKNRCNPFWKGSLHLK